MEFSVLIERAQAQDRAALDALYARYESGVLGAVRRRLSPALRRMCDSTDVVQSVFAEVIRDIPRIENQGEAAFRNWLLLKTSNKVRTKLRRHLGRGGKRVMLPLDAGAPAAASGPGPASEAVINEDVQQAAGLFDTLDEQNQELVRLRLDDDLSFAEIAEKLGLPSADAARKRYARAIVKLREQFPE